MLGEGWERTFLNNMAVKSSCPTRVCLQEVFEPDMEGLMVKVDCYILDFRR